jgi:hypothetical protein
MEAGLNETTLRIGWRRQMLDLDKMPARRRSTTGAAASHRGLPPGWRQGSRWACPGIARAAADLGLDKITVE